MAATGRRDGDGRLAHDADLLLGLIIEGLLVVALVGLTVADRWRRRLSARR